MFQVLPEYPVPFRVIPFSSAAMLRLPSGCGMTLPGAALLPSACRRRAFPCKSLKFKISVGSQVSKGQQMSKLSRSSHALVTGGGRGIGRAIAAALSEAGAVVTILGRNRGTLDDAVASGAAQFAAVADVSDQAAVR